MLYPLNKPLMLSIFFSSAIVLSSSLCRAETVDPWKDWPPKTSLFRQGQSMQSHISKKIQEFIVNTTSIRKKAFGTVAFERISNATMISCHHFRLRFNDIEYLRKLQNSIWESHWDTSDSEELLRKTEAARHVAIRQQAHLGPYFSDGIIQATIHWNVSDILDSNFDQSFAPRFMKHHRRGEIGLAPEFLLEPEASGAFVGNDSYSSTLTLSLADICSQRPLEIFVFVDCTSSNLNDLLSCQPTSVLHLVASFSSIEKKLNEPGRVLRSRHLDYERSSR